MDLTDDERRRYARQLLLGNWDDQAQLQLLRTRGRVPDDADGGSASVALDYLQRAGLGQRVPAADDSQEDDRPELILELPTAREVDAKAGDPSLRVASAALLGALSAVEAIKQAGGVGGAGHLHPVPRLTGGDPASVGQPSSTEAT